MYAYKIKELAKRGTALLGAAGMLAGIGTTAIPVLVSADALNPLTERSLTLSSSSPGWSYLDGSNNPLYAPPNSGANGQKTGNTFSFRVSSTSAGVKAMTFQYCTTPAGNCTAPGDNGHTGASRNADSTSTTDLNVTTSSPDEIDSGDWATIAASADKTPDRDGSEGNFVVLTGSTSSVSYAGASDDWTMDAVNSESGGTIAAGTATGANNMIRIRNSTGLATTAGDYFRITFFGTDDNYITNPGSGAFFVRINTYSDDTTLNDTTLIDGGVTVANVMNQSITIQTKVLETMDFSVGVKDPNTITFPNSNVTTNAPTLAASGHAQCSPILMKDPTLSPTDYGNATNNVLKLGDSSAEFSLKTDTAYAVDSYWRLSSNSSGGATVYYSGHTLTNTVNDQITPLSDNPSSDASSVSTTGTEQFGLGINHGSGGATVNGSPVAQVFPVGDDSYGSGSGSFADYVTTQANDTKAHLPRLYPLVPTPSYGGANGTITSGGTAKFAFNNNADTYAIPLATETTDVVNCVTAKMRYVANIAATTPAGIYTTKVNYVASPQY